MDHRTFWYGGFASLLVVSACSLPPVDAPPPADAGDDGPSDFPPLPDDCDVTLPVLSTGSHFRATARTRFRIVEGTVYSPGDDSINAIQISGGAPVPIMPYPTFATRSDAASSPAMFHDFWIDHESIVGVLAGALFTAPLTGGATALVPGSSWPSAEEALFGRELYVKAGPYVYATSQLSTGGRGIRRHALAGGPPSDFLSFNNPSNRPDSSSRVGTPFTMSTEPRPGARKPSSSPPPLTRRSRASSLQSSVHRPSSVATATSMSSKAED